VPFAPLVAVQNPQNKVTFACEFWLYWQELGRPAMLGNLTVVDNVTRWNTKRFGQNLTIEPPTTGEKKTKSSKLTIPLILRLFG